jgi:hypothetical protein
MFADYELRAHRLAAQDQPITAEISSTISSRDWSAGWIFKTKQRISTEVNEGVPLRRFVRRASRGWRSLPPKA